MVPRGRRGRGAAGSDNSSGSDSSDEEGPVRLAPPAASSSDEDFMDGLDINGKVLLLSLRPSSVLPPGCVYLRCQGSTVM